MRASVARITGTIHLLPAAIFRLKFIADLPRNDSRDSSPRFFFFFFLFVTLVRDTLRKSKILSNGFAEDRFHSFVIRERIESLLLKNVHGSMSGCGFGARARGRSTRI